MIFVRVILPILALCAIAYIIYWAISRVLEVRKEDKFHKVDSAREKVKVAKDLGEYSGTVTNEEVADLMKAKSAFGERLDLGKKAE